MKRLALPALAAIALSGDAARADESFDSFRSFCVASRGQSVSALALADAAGWAPVPAQSLAQLPLFQGAEGRARQIAGGVQLLLTARGNQPDLGVVRICAIGVVPTGASDLAGQLQVFAGVPRQTAPSLPEGLYAWRDQNGLHASVDRAAPDFGAQFASGAVLVAAATTTPQMTLILLMSTAQ